MTEVKIDAHPSFACTSRMLSATVYQLDVAKLSRAGLLTFVPELFRLII